MCLFETERLYIRHWKQEDDVPFAHLNAHHDVMRYLPARLTRRQSDRLRAAIVREISQSGIGFWALEVKQSGCFIGFTGIEHVRKGTLPFAPAVEIGWRLARQAWGRGYASEAARAVLQHSFDVLHLPEIVSFTAVENLRSRAVMERTGMTRNPHNDFDHPALKEEHPLRCHVLYRIDRNHYDDSRQQSEKNST